eukprot:2312256-Amphidinium_carterae.1
MPPYIKCATTVLARLQRWIARATRGQRQLFPSHAHHDAFVRFSPNSNTPSKVLGGRWVLAFQSREVQRKT